MRTTDDRRTDELERTLLALSERVSSACVSAGRQPSEVTTVVVTKTWPVTDVRRLFDLGVRNLAENRDQEAKVKADQCADLAITWHFVGQLQRNKANSVARYADYVHSVDRSELAEALDSGAGRVGRRLGCFVQVSLADVPAEPGPHRGGADPRDVLEVCGSIAASQNLDLVGLMAVAPLGEEPEPAFDRLATLRQSVTKDFPEAAWLSAGMSGDLEAAIAIGATHVRVGSAVLGEREHVR